MAATLRSQIAGMNLAAAVTAFADWLRAHRGAVTMAALLSCAVPITFLVGNLGVIHEPTPAMVIELALWYLSYGLEQWCLMLAVGYALQRLNPAGRYARIAVRLLGACAVAAAVNLSTEGRAPILIEEGVVDSVQTMHLYAFIAALIMALLFFAHLQRSLEYEEAAARLGAAQAGQREARRRVVQARLQAVQARIDPQLLFDMLDAVRRCYEVDPSRAEELLDGLIAFLRASLPRLRSASSTVVREAELARSYVRLRALAGASAAHMTLEVPSDLMNARFPPGVLLPLLSDVLRTQAGPCGLAATQFSGNCVIVLTLPARPSDTAVSRVRALLTDLYGSEVELTLNCADRSACATMKVPYELA
jgi:hypothetical protein